MGATTVPEKFRLGQFFFRLREATLVGAARALREQGVVPRSVTQPHAHRRRSASVVLPRDIHGVAGSAEFREARAGVNTAAD